MANADPHRDELGPYEVEADGDRLIREAADHLEGVGLTDQAEAVRDLLSRARELITQRDVLYYRVVVLTSASEARAVLAKAQEAEQ